MTDNANNRGSAGNGVPPSTERYAPERGSEEGVATNEPTAHRWVAGQTGSGVTYPKNGNESGDHDNGGDQ
jgi:hypothetical protein